MSSQPWIVALALALVFAVGIICALITSILSWLGGANLANSMLRGGTSLGGVLLIGIGLLTALNVLSRS
jgi:hypothetical protein